MHKILTAILLSTSLFAGLNIVSQDNLTGVQEEIQLYDKTYALIIGIDSYPALEFNQQL